jgi:integrase
VGPVARKRRQPSRNAGAPQAGAFTDEHLDAARLCEDGKAPLFRSAIGRTGQLTVTPIDRVDAYRMIRRPMADARFKKRIGCHGFRATGITAFLEAGGGARERPGHGSARESAYYRASRRTGDDITLGEVERITI